MTSQNFVVLKKHDQLIRHFSRIAEQAFVIAPTLTLLKLRQLSEAIAQGTTSRLGIEIEERSTQLDLLKKSQYEIDLSREVANIFHTIRKIGKETNYEFTSNHRKAMQSLTLA